MSSSEPSKLLSSGSPMSAAAAVVDQVAPHAVDLEAERSRLLRDTADLSVDELEKLLKDCFGVIQCS